MRIRNTLCLAIAGVALLGAGASPAQIEGARLAPLNPEFVDMMKARTAGQVMLKNTRDGHGLGHTPSPLDLSHLVSEQGGRSFARGAPTNTLYDLRTLGRVTPVKDQGDYGTCWAFAALGSLESCLLLNPGETHDFSENNMANLAGFDLGFDDGGNGNMATAYLTRWGGPVNDSSDPYPNPGGSPAGLLPVKHVQNIEIIGRRITSLANDALKEAVTNRGAVYVSMCWDWASYGFSNSAYYKATPENSDHAVAIVGWNDQYPRTNFALPQPSGDGAFIVRNSWGTNLFGDEGYFYVSYYDTVFARSSSYVFYGAEPTATCSQIYQYDPLGWVSSVGFASNVGWAANVFTVTNNGDLNAVSFYAVTTNLNYNLYVYTDVTGGEPVSGTLRASQAGSFTNAGYYTVGLSSPIELSSGRTFSVVVRHSTSGYRYPLAVEYALAGYSSRATAAPGQSYLSADGASWSDTTAEDATMNNCIKAFMRTNSYPCSSPASFTASDGAFASCVYLSWSHAPGATSYNLYRNTADNALNATLLANVADMEYYDMTAVPGVYYYYWIKTVGAAGLSDFSRVDRGYALLTPPATITATAGTYSDRIQVSWSPVTGAAGYMLYRHQIDSSNTASELVRSSALTYADTSAGPGISYYYWVKAYGAASTSVFSGMASGYRSLLVPGSVSASGGTYASGVLVSWSAVSGAVSYRIWRSATADSSSAAPVGETADLAFVDTTATPGTTYYYWVQAKRWSITGGLSGGASGWRRSMAAGNNARGDIDGDGIMDFAVYMEANGMWYARISGNSYATVTYQLGAPGYIPVACDYDGDGRTDPTVYYEPDGLWVSLLSASGNAPAYAVIGGWGFRPVAGDFDGDGRADAVLYQESTGTWKGILSRRNYGYVSVFFGGPGFKAAAADFDGDGIMDPAVYHESAGQGLGYWHLALSGSGYQITVRTTSGISCIPVPADFDGDRKADLALYNAANGAWKYWSSASNFAFPVAFTLGGAGYDAVPADYDGDYLADITVYHAQTGRWYFLLSSRNYASEYGELGGPGYEAVGARR